VHRISNPFEVPVEFIEVQLGEYFGEDDIIRLQDDYQRT
jgi:mannose-6-phosphate isomerase-like protein (cupin superfamily)